MKTVFLLFLIFILAAALRFIHFPNDIIFSYEPARDAYHSLEVAQGDFKIIGPPSSVNPNIFHSPLIYYIWALPLYLSGNDPMILSGFMRILNSLGVFLVFLIAVNLFNKKVGFMAALLYAFSFEQIQYSLFLGHPAITVLTVLIFYLGLSLAIFKKNKWGLMIAFLGLGLSLQFHYVQIFLLPILFLMLIIFRKSFQWDLKIVSLSVLVFLLSISSFILTEIKFNFRISQNISSGFLSSLGGGKTTGVNLFQAWIILQRYVQDNLFFNNQITFFVFLLIFISVIVLIKKKSDANQLIFLLIWLVGGLIVYILTSSESYYYSGGASISLLIIASYVIYLVWRYSKILGFIILSIVLYSNLYLTFSTLGPNQFIFNQPGMFLSDEEKAIDYMYLKAENKPFSVNALTIPLYVNTTWSYLFEFYANKKYNYMPVWGGTLASGYPGGLKSEDKRSLLPQKQFLIIESTRGLHENQEQDFLKEENYFSKLVDSKKFGQIIVEEREKF